MSRITPTRRTVVRTAAWSLPAVTVAAAAPAYAASREATYQTVTKTFVYSALGIADITVEVTAVDVPLTAPAGETLRQIQTSSTVTIPANLAGILRTSFLGGADQVSGTSASTSQLTGALTLPSTTNLTIPLTPFPTNAPLVTVASGAGGALTVPAGTAPGVVTITMGEPTSQLVGHNADGSPNGSVYDSTLAKKTGNDYVLATFEIV